MYRLNTLGTDVLIVPDEVRFHAPSKKEADTRAFQHGIIIAEQRFVVPLMGSKFYYDMAASKNRIVTSGNIVAMQTLVDAEGYDYTLEVGEVLNAVEFMSEDNRLLWTRLLWKYVAEVTMISATPDAFVQFGSVGLVHGNPPASAVNAAGEVAPSLQTVKWLLDKKMQDRIQPLEQALKFYLCENRGKYPLFNGEGCPGCDSGPESTRATPWINIYDDDDDACGCSRDSRRPRR